MSRREPRLALSQMLGHAREAYDLIEAKSRGDFDQQRLLELARLRDCQGEAVLVVVMAPDGLKPLLQCVGRFPPLFLRCPHPLEAARSQCRLTGLTYWKSCACGF
jgi:hypothetical protein